MYSRKQIPLGIILIIFSFSSLASTKDYSEEQLFQNFAYAACVASAYQSKEVTADANRAASGYLEFGHLSLDAYQEIQKRINTWLEKKYISKSGKSLQLMKCIDFYHSGDIQKIYKKYTPQK